MNLYTGIAIALVTAYAVVGVLALAFCRAAKRAWVTPSLADPIDETYRWSAKDIAEFERTAEQIRALPTNVVGFSTADFDFDQHGNPQ